jgi:hypothetical protein
MFPENVKIEYLQDSFFKKISFFDKIRKVSLIKLLNDKDSLLREQFAVIKFKEPYFYT